MSHIFLAQLIVFLFIGLNILLLNWLFPTEPRFKKKHKSKKV